MRRSVALAACGCVLLAAVPAFADEGPEEMLARAAALERDGKLADAVALYGEILDRYPDNARAYNNFGAVLLRAGKLGEAKQAFRKAAELDPGYHTPLNNLGYLYLVEEDYEEAGPLLIAAAEMDPNDESALNNLRAFYIVQNKYGEAAAEWEKLNALAPGNARIKQDLAGIYIKLGDFAAAEKWAKATLALDAENVDARLNLALVYRLTSRPARAEKLLVALARSRGDDVNVQLALREVYLAEGKLDLALAAARAAAELDPSPDTLLGLAGVYYETGAYDDGIAACDRALKLRDDAAGHNLKGRGLYFAGRLAEAEKELSLAVARDDGFAAAHKNLADVFYQKWLFEQARDHYEKAFALDGQDENARVMAGYCHYQLGDLARARKTFEEVLAAAPANVKALNGLAAVARAEGDRDAALDYCLQALAAAPENAEALNTSGVIYGELGDYKKSYDALAKLLAQKPEPAYAYANFGVAAARTGRWREARDAFAAAAAKEPKDLQAQAGLGLAAAKIEDWDGAAAALEAAAQISANNPIVLYGRALVAGGRGDEAAREDLLRRVIARKKEWEERGYFSDALTALAFEEASAAVGKGR